MPFHIRLAAQDAGGGAGGVQQDGIEGGAVPPGVRVAGVALQKGDVGAQPCQVLANPGQPFAFQLQGGEVCGGEFLAQLPGFAAGGGAGIEDATVGRGLQ